ncbi:hypothetical protein J9102_004339 [Vibrio vulnificus]|nr:hypothetical protein [Vibrio vulnificus]EME0812563.1 hypothetical protein [Vibrio vulnificus]
MNIYKSDAIEYIDQNFEGLISKINSNTNDLFSLLDDTNDWAFIIKLSAFIDLLLNDALNRRLQESGLKSFIESSPLYGKNSKTELARNLGLLTKGQCSFVQQIAEMRNVCAHDFSAISFNFEDYLAGKDQNQRKSWVNKLNFFEGEAKKSFSEFYRDMPRYGLIIGTIILSATIEGEVMKSRLSGDLDLLELKASRDLLGFA